MLSATLTVAQAMSKTTSGFILQFLECLGSLECEPAQQVQRVVVRGIAPKSVVDAARPVEIAVGGVLQRELGVLLDEETGMESLATTRSADAAETPASAHLMAKQSASMAFANSHCREQAHPGQHE